MSFEMKSIFNRFNIDESEDVNLFQNVIEYKCMPIQFNFLLYNKTKNISLTLFFMVVKIRKFDKKMVFVMKLMFRMEDCTVSLSICYSEINEELIKSGPSYTNYIL